MERFARHRVEIAGSIASLMGASPAGRVGFGRHFSVELRTLWANEGHLPPVSERGKFFK
jgi:hypothetical protein